MNGRQMGSIFPILVVSEHQIYYNRFLNRLGVGYRNRLFKWVWHKNQMKGYRVTYAVVLGEPDQSPLWWGEMRVALADVVLNVLTQKEF